MGVCPKRFDEVFAIIIIEQTFCVKALETRIVKIGSFWYNLTLPQAGVLIALYSQWVDCLLNCFDPGWEFLDRS